MSALRTDWRSGKLQAQLQGVAVAQVFASPDKKLFVGLSNSGIPGTAVIVFDDRGAIRLLVNHGLAEFDYCEKSVTIVRRWYDQENPNVQFVSSTEPYGPTMITLRDCRGRIVDLIDVVLKAYNSAFQRAPR